jgi:hypothetical protein
MNKDLHNCIVAIRNFAFISDEDGQATLLNSLRSVADVIGKGMPKPQHGINHLLMELKAKQHIIQNICIPHVFQKFNTDTWGRLIDSEDSVEAYQVSCHDSDVVSEPFEKYSNEDLVLIIED